MVRFACDFIVASNYLTTKSCMNDVTPSHLADEYTGNTMNNVVFSSKEIDADSDTNRDNLASYIAVRLHYQQTKLLL